MVNRVDDDPEVLDAVDEVLEVVKRVDDDPEVLDVDVDEVLKAVDENTEASDAVKEVP